MTSKLNLIEVNKFYFKNGKILSQKKITKKRQIEEDCNNCTYLTESGKFCTVPALISYRKGRCVYKKERQL